jgi:hypothetical protein
MKPKVYLFFNLNLRFSFIEEKVRLDVFQNCYHQLSDLIEETGILIRIKLTDWTLKQVDPL